MKREYQEVWGVMNRSKSASLDWFRNARYGMFIHWGLYARLGGVWDGKPMEVDGNRHTVAEWIMESKKIPRDRYKTIANHFEPIQFNAKDWVSLAKASGMRYIVLTSKHHDGFALFKSDVSAFNIADGTPFMRDVVDELYRECQKQGIQLGLYYSHSYDWMDGGDGGWKDYNPDNKTNSRNHWDPSAVSFDDYLVNKSLPQVQELLNRYHDLCLIWYDVPSFMPENYSFTFYKTAYDLAPNTLINSRVGNGFGDYVSAGDNEIPEGTGQSKPWETPGTMNNSWGYKSYDSDWKTPFETLYWIVEIISKGGNYLLNVGPDGNGLIPYQCAESLRVSGKWISKNEEAIFGSSPWEVRREGTAVPRMEGTRERDRMGFHLRVTTRDFWFTCRGNAVYAFCLAESLGLSLTITSFAGKRVKAVSLLSSGDPLPFQNTSSGLEIDCSSIADRKLGVVFRCELQEHQA